MSLPPVREEDGFEEDEDIYRGERPPSLRTFTRQQEADADASSIATSSSSSSSSSSSNSSLNIGRKLGGLAAVVEQAISRWARKHSSASSVSSGSSSTSSASSTPRTVTTRRRRRRRNSSTVSLKSAEHERALLARKRARARLRVSPREFVLLEPPHLAQMHQVAGNDVLERTMRTTSMPLVLSHLEDALKKSSKPHRVPQKTSPNVTGAASNGETSAATHSKKKGKAVDTGVATDVPNPAPQGQRKSAIRERRQSWWLDVSSPTWDDMRELGKILRLHPLTLEDILHQEPREKLELFPRLGYYFVVFRALEGERTREQFRRLKVPNSSGAELPGASIEDGAVDAVNVYLVVFKEGICSFHFEDISEHTDKVRSRVLQLEGTLNLSSEWIAHGILDSIVDTFFPVLNVIEKEVKVLDTLVSGETRAEDSQPEPIPTDHTPNRQRVENTSEEKKKSEGSERVGADEKEAAAISEKPVVRSDSPKISFRLSSAPFFSSLSFHRTRKWIHRAFRPSRSVKTDKDEDQEYSPTYATLLRMASARRMVTSLTRLLSSKSEVVAQIRKRLLMSSSMGIWDSKGSTDDVAIYMGDVYDHILTLQQLLAEYERMLSQSHPAYLSQLRTSQAIARGGTDTAILVLTIVSMMALCIQCFVGIFSMNVQVPHNTRFTFQGPAGGPLNVFIIIVACAFLIGTGFLLLVRHWRVVAKKERNRRI
ncbi:hypothetical protein SCHPADRAFT_822110 [Schizopora paradoxa]|uniref:Cora-domain-containing protein n=1 Tax=Schizopora paradoxa TaxID=27342 RepID=A0A0H2S5Y0_9AGAM|nr:hypothetical protein SCHPADRAFT_822110 [Schizopora paradoxa]